MNNKLIHSVLHNSLVLLVLALLSGILLALVYTNSSDAIAEQQRRAERATLAVLFGSADYDNDLLDASLSLDPRREDFSNIELLGLREPTDAYLLQQNGELSGIILPAVAREGYNGDIHLLAGIKRSGEIAAVRVTRHRETPGLGDKIELRLSDWILDFNGRSLDNPAGSEWTVQADGGVFDQFTGATITPRALTQKVRDVLEFYERNQETFANR